MPDFNDSAFWPAFKAAGMLVTATVTIGSVTTVVDVAFERPDLPKLSGIGRSTEYEIEYQQADLPDLAEGCAVVIDGVNYVVRERPYVPEVPARGTGGFWRRATLSKV